MSAEPNAVSAAIPEAPAASAASAPAGARRPSAGGPGRRAPYPVRRKVCRFCAEKVRDIDYKQIQILRT
ncbi:MAG: 30S ribosomal protein S18, partial [Elusimicrobia bacterium]|nr:30S ribosomal protein S18 [Elusimicrobiota bacterium]